MSPAWLMIGYSARQKRAARQRWLDEVLPFAGTPGGIDRAMEAFRAEAEEPR